MHFHRSLNLEPSILPLPPTLLPLVTSLPSLGVLSHLPIENSPSILVSPKSGEGASVFYSPLPLDPEDPVSFTFTDENTELFLHPLAPGAFFLSPFSRSSPYKLLSPALAKTNLEPQQEGAHSWGIDTDSVVMGRASWKPQAKLCLRKPQEGLQASPAWPLPGWNSQWPGGTRPDYKVPIKHYFRILTQ